MDKIYNNIATSFFILFLWIGSGTIGKAQVIITLHLPNPCLSVGVNDENVKNQSGLDFTVSPNPTQGECLVHISSNKTIGLAEFQFINTQGACVLKEQFYSSNRNCVKNFNLSNLSEGIYAITILTEKDRLTKKVILTKK